ncbi:MAG: glycosyl hydrolase, partial [Armatimonadota bacterium]
FAGIDTMQLRALNEWVGRCATLLTGGHQATDIAVVYPIESLWPRFTPARHRATDSPSAAEVEQVFDGVSEGLFAARRDFTYIDSRTLAEGAVADGAVVHGDMRWRVIVLPYVDTLPDAAWRKLAELERTGGVIVAVAARPTNSAREFPSARTVQLGERMLGTSAEPSVASYGRGTGIYLPRSAAGLLPMMLDTLLEPDAEVRDDRSPIRMTHRRIDGREVYFLINDSGEQIDETVSLCVSGSGKRWDPATGDVSPVTSGEGLPLHLGPHEGIIYTFGEAREAKLSHPAGGALPGMIVESLPRVEPTEGHGEFVRAEVRPDEVNSTPERAVWRAVGTLTKGAVDTFLFTSFNYPEGIDLSRAESLVIDTWAPDGQATPSQILCILHERNGANYLAPIGRSLATPGHVQAYLPLSKLQLAGWSKDANGRLDADQIIRVSIGWGGYFGTEGETITYGLALPRTARRTRSSAEPPAVRPNAPAR